MCMDGIEHWSQLGEVTQNGLFLGCFTGCLISILYNHKELHNRAVEIVVLMGSPSNSPQKEYMC